MMNKKPSPVPAAPSAPTEPPLCAICGKPITAFCTIDHVFPQAIYKWQHGECLPTVDNLLALARLLRVSMEDLLVYEDQGVSHFYQPFYKRKNISSRVFAAASAFRAALYG